MNRRIFITGTLATVAALKFKPTLAEENLEEFTDQVGLPDGANAKAMRRFETNPDEIDNIELAYFVEVFETDEAAKAWYELSRDSVVAFYQDLDMTDHEVESELLEVDAEIGDEAYGLSKPMDMIFSPTGATSLHAYKNNVVITIEHNFEQALNLLIAFAEEVQKFEIEDPTNKKQLLALLPTEDDAKELFDGMKTTHENVAIIVNGEWEDE